MEETVIEYMVKTEVNPNGFRLVRRMATRGIHTISYRYFLPIGHGNAFEEITEKEFKEYKSNMVGVLHD